MVRNAVYVSLVLYTRLTLHTHGAENGLGGRAARIGCRPQPDVIHEPAASSSTRGPGALLHQREGALLGLVARLEQTLNRLFTRSMLLAAHNATLLRLHQILLVETTAGVLGCSVEHFCLGTDGLGSCHSILLIEYFWESWECPFTPIQSI